MDLGLNRAVYSHVIGSYVECNVCITKIRSVLQRLNADLGEGPRSYYVLDPVCDNPTPRYISALLEIRGGLGIAKEYALFRAFP
jgi:hypothetical protein